MLFGAIHAAMRLRCSGLTACLGCLVCAACSIGALACGRSQASNAEVEAVPRPAATVRSEAAQPSFVDAGNWASKVGASLDQPVRAPATAPVAAVNVHAAVMPDDGEDTDEPVLAGRLVYRVNFSLPASFRDRRAAVQAPAGELHVDLSRSRLRARFVGPGWPVPEGSELRLRADLPGLYLFDGDGGRSLGAGQLASWFEGQTGDRSAATRAAIRRDWGPRASGPLAGDMICALLAEWSNQPREALAYRCEPDALPPGFRIGPWTAELTAVVPLQLPRRTLRADDREAPRGLPTRRPTSALLEPATLGQLVPSHASEGAPAATLVVENRSSSRVLIIAQGVPVGWVDAGSTLPITGFAPGWYRIGAVRPLGILRMPPKLIRVPSQLTIGRADPPARVPTDGSPAPAAGDTDAQLPPS
jgi:hypothetical protein